MKVAVTSQNFRTVTSCAGKTRRFIIFDVTPSGAVEVGQLDLPKAASIQAYRGVEPHPIEQCGAVVTAGCGEGFRRRMQGLGISVFVSDCPDPAEAARSIVAP